METPLSTLESRSDTQDAEPRDKDIYAEVRTSTKKTSQIQSKNKHLSKAKLRFSYITSTTLLLVGVLLALCGTQMWYIRQVSRLLHGIDDQIKVLHNISNSRVDSGNTDEKLDNLIQRIDEITQYMTGHAGRGDSARGYFSKLSSEQQTSTGPDRQVDRLVAEVGNLTIATVKLGHAIDMLANQTSNVDTRLNNLDRQTQQRIDNLSANVELHVDRSYNLSVDTGSLRQTLANVTSGIHDLLRRTRDWTTAAAILNNKTDTMQNYVTNLDQSLAELTSTVGNGTTYVSSLSSQIDAQTYYLASIYSEIGNTTKLVTTCLSSTGTFPDCQALSDHGIWISGVYKIGFKSEGIREVYCDMATSGGGWTVLLRRQDGSVDFNKPWSYYRDGFGDLTGEFWAGNELLHQMTSSVGKPYRLRVDLVSYSGEQRHAEYDLFKVDSESDNYRLHLGMYSGNATDALAYSNGNAFTTTDRDNDRRGTYNCADRYQAGWWHNSCYYALLTGPYGANLPNWQGIIWYQWLGSSETMKLAEMKIRPA